jgi:hypothetical protein
VQPHVVLWCVAIVAMCPHLQTSLLDSIDTDAALVCSLIYQRPPRQQDPSFQLTNDILSAVVKILLSTKLQSCGVLECELALESAPVVFRFNTFGLSGPAKLILYDQLFH